MLSKEIDKNAPLGTTVELAVPADQIETGPFLEEARACRSRGSFLLNLSPAVIWICSVW